jgi:hypothetical protein
MSVRLFAICLALLLAAPLLPGCTPDKAPATAPPPAPVAVAPPPAEALPELYGGGGQAGVLKEVQQRIVLPFGTPLPADSSRVVVRFEVSNLGSVEEAHLVRGLSPVVDSAVLAAVRQLSFHTSSSASYPLTVPAPGVASPAQRREATTRWQRTAVRLPGEADSTFVRRVLPISYFPPDIDDLQALAWRPSRYGRQLVFTSSVTEPEGPIRGWQTVDMFVLDPFRPHTYAVQRMHFGNMGDVPGQSAQPFLADANGDGRPDLLVLLTYDQSADGGGHMSYYRVEVWQTAGLDKAGRPRYREDKTPYPYLEYRQDETPGPYPKEFTPATVRRLLARHQRRLLQRRRPLAPPSASAAADTTKKAGAASPQEGGPGQ